jgi:hypothetical protein
VVFQVEHNTVVKIGILKKRGCLYTHRKCWTDYEFHLSINDKVVTSYIKPCQFKNVSITAHNIALITANK